MDERDDRPLPPPRHYHWTEWFDHRIGWTVLLAGGVLCAVAVLLSG